MRRARRGTTVLELVVALLVTGMVAAAGARAFEQVIDRRAQVLDATSSTERDSALRALLHEWIDGGATDPSFTTVMGEQMMRQSREVPRALRDQIPALRLIAYSASDALYFTTTVVSAVNESMVRVRLYVDDDADTPERGLTFEYQPRGAGQPSTRVELDPTVRRMRVTYLDSTTRQWRTLDALGSAQAIAARVQLGVDDPTRSRLLALPLTFPITRSATAERIGERELLP